MTDVLVCIKRVPDASGRGAAHRRRPGRRRPVRRVHGQRAREAARSSWPCRSRRRRAGGDRAHPRPRGGRRAAARRAGDGLRGGGAGRGRRRRASVRPTSPREIAAVVAAHAAAGRTYDLVLLGNDAADTGDFQVGIRLAYELGRPVVNGVEHGRGRGRRRRRRGATGPTASRPTRCRCPAVVTVLEGGVEPRYPSVSGRMKAKKVTIETRGAAARAGRHRPGAARRCRPPQPSTVEVLGEGPDAAPAVVDLLRAAGGGAMILVFVETDPVGSARADRPRCRARPSRSPATVAERTGGPVHAVVVGACPAGDWSTSSAPTASPRSHHADRRRRRGLRRGAAWAAAVQAAVGGHRRRRRDRRRNPARQRGARPPGRARWTCRWPPTSSPSVASARAVRCGSPARSWVARCSRRWSCPSAPPCSRSPGTPSRPSRPVHRRRRRVREFSPERRGGRPGRAGGVDRAGCGATCRAPPHVGAGRRRRRARCRGPRTGSTTCWSWPTCSAARSASPAWSPAWAGVRTTSRSARPGAGSPRTSTSRAASAGPSSTGPAARARRRSWRSTPTPNAPMVTKANYAVIGDLHEIVPAINAEIKRRRG